jgi:hypothetical protein
VTPTPTREFVLAAFVEVFDENKNNLRAEHP